MISMAIRALLPKSLYSFEEISDTHWPKTSAVYSCPGKPGKINFQITSFTKDEGSFELPEELSDLLKDKSKLTTYHYDFKEEM